MKILFVNFLLITMLFAELKVGDSIPSLTLVNQFDERVEISKEGSSTLLLSFEKDISADIQEFLEKQDDNFLSDNHMVYISDISSLPTFLVNIFVLPSLKKFDFKVALIYDENELNREEKKATLIYLKDNMVTDIIFIEASKLKDFMAKPTSS